MNYDELPKFVCDDIHYNGKKMFGYNKPFNMVLSEREAGKSTLMVKLCYDFFRNTGKPTIILRRRTADITEQYLYDTFVTIPQNFTNGECPEAKFKKSSITQGMVDITLCGKLWIRVIAMSAPLMRLKSAALPPNSLKYMFLDEAVVNARMGEKYLANEAFAIKEIYNTYNRFTYKRDEGKALKFIAFGNPYSYYHPIIADWGVNVNEMHPGVILTGDTWCVECYQICDELKEKIISSNPLFRMNSIYTDYAMKGIAINDMNFRIMDKQPEGFSLYYCFKLHGKTVGVYRGLSDDLHYWTCLLDENNISRKRNVLCYDFGDMSNDRTILSERGKKDFMLLKGCIRYRQIAHRSAEEASLIEELYQLL